MQILMQNEIIVAQILTIRVRRFDSTLSLLNANYLVVEI